MPPSVTPHEAASVRSELERNPALVERVLHLFRQYGWETGLKKLRAETEASPDLSQRQALLLFSAWLAGERGAYQEAAKLFNECAQMMGLAPWAFVGQAFVALRQKQYPRALELIQRAEHASQSPDPILEATIFHLRGAVAHHQGKSAQALDLLKEALRLFGRNHFGTGRVLDTFGMVYQVTDHFQTAEECYQTALELKQRFEDQEGVAVTLGNLGRLYFDWGLLDQAEKYFEQNWQLSQHTSSQWGMTLMQNWLARIAVLRGQQAAAMGRQGQARQHWQNAAELLHACATTAAAQQWLIPEGYARKDLALLHVAEGNLDGAEQEAKQVQTLFEKDNFVEGIAHVDFIWGLIYRQRGRFEEALRKFTTARERFASIGEPAEVARTEFELARTQRDAKKTKREVIKSEVIKSFQQALHSAEACRRAQLVSQIEEELKEFDVEAYYQHIFERVRGRAAPAETSSLLEGQRVHATVLYLDLKDSSLYARQTDPVVVQATLNQMMATLVPVLRRHGGVVSGFRGDGFLAVFLGSHHAVTAVNAALDLFAELTRFNEPRALLDLPEFKARIGIATGGMAWGNVGTYDKIDCTVIGTPANLGARLEMIAEVGLPCICIVTHQEVGDRFLYKDPAGRSIDLKSFGFQQVWDVSGRNPANSPRR